MRCHEIQARFEPVRVRSIAGWIGRNLIGGALFTLLVACATTSEGTDTADTLEVPESGQATVVVNNDLLPSSSVSVWIVWESGRQILVGSVGPGQRRELEYEFPRGVANFRLRARPVGGDEIVSNSFSLYDDARVHWALRANVAVVVGTRDP